MSAAATASASSPAVEEEKSNKADPEITVVEDVSDDEEVLKDVKLPPTPSAVVEDEVKTTDSTASPDEPQPPIQKDTSSTSPDEEEETLSSTTEQSAEDTTTPSNKKPTATSPPAAPSSPRTSFSYSTPPSFVRRTSSGGGLSELSKQLRILQAKNENQRIEIDRLERQLRILAELQGISVSDLRRALEEACQAEAFQEWQSRVAALRAQLVAASLANHRPSAAARNANSNNNDGKEHPKSSDSYNASATAMLTSAKMKIANLELRIGELEEIDETKRTEIQNLYEDLKEQKELATRLDAQCQSHQSEKEQWSMQKAEQEQLLTQQQKQMEELQKKGRRIMQLTQKKEQKQMEELKKMEQKQVEELHKQKKEVQSEQKLKTLPKEQQEQKQRDNQAAAAAAAASAAAAAAEKQRMTMAHQQQVQQLQQQLQQLQWQQQQQQLQYQQQQQQQQAWMEDRARRAETELQVQKDQGQLSEQQRLAAEEQARLRNAQFKARFLVQEENIKDMEQQLASLYAAYEMVQEEQQQDDEKREMLKTNLDEADAEVARQIRDAGDSNDNNSSMSTMGSPGKIPESPSPAVTPARSHSAQLVLVGELLIHNSGGGFLKKAWKKRKASLFSTLTHHHLELEGLGGFTIEFGVSTVEAEEPLNQKQCFRFVLEPNPNQQGGVAIHAAAINQADYDRWMAALKAATTGEEHNVEAYPGLMETEYSSSAVDESHSSSLEMPVDLTGRFT